MEIEDILPAPFPFIPLPRFLVNRSNGLRPYKAYSLRGIEVEYLGTVYGEDKGEAIEAAENLAEVTGGGFDAVGVVRE